MKRLATTALLIAVGAMLQACSSVPLPQKTQDPASTRIDQAIKTQEEMPVFTASSVAKPSPPKEAGPLLALDYAGEAKVLLKRLASANEMDFRVQGPQPYLPLFVIVSVKDASLIDVLRDVGEQFGERADLVLKDKVIEVNYRAQ